MNPVGQSPTTRSSVPPPPPPQGPTRSSSRPTRSSRPDHGDPGQPGHGGPHPHHQPHAGRLHQPGRPHGHRPAPDRRGGRTVCREVVCAGELRRKVSEERGGSLLSFFMGIGRSADLYRSGLSTSPRESGREGGKEEWGGEGQGRGNRKEEAGLVVKGAFGEGRKRGELGRMCRMSTYY